MKLKFNLLGFIAVVFLAGNLTAQQDSTLYKVLRSPDNFLNKHVVVRGIIDQYIPIELDYEKNEVEKTVAYVLKGDFGDRIYIKSHLEVPSTNTKYEVTGMFQKSSELHIDYEIIETRRVRITTITEEKSVWEQYNLAFLGVGAGVVLLLIVLLSVNVMKKRPVPQLNKENPVHVKPAEVEYSSHNEFSTIKIATNVPKTMRFIPGALEIVSGEDKGKSFKMVGYPTPDGSIITMGRENGSGERSYSHILLKDQTVSRKQAELVYKGNKLYLKNLSETNFTIVNGKELAVNEQIELQPNDSVIRVGALEFKYVL